ncbi:MAG: MMPL family transporter, partial [Streptomycetaceae bacterium]|nr:MMPL family transporter [Streptomycetaceae bacterium]
MATFLYRLGRGAFRRRGRVLLVWLGVLVAVAVGAMGAPEASDEEFSMPGIESQKAFDLMEERFPGTAADGATARVVFVAPNGQKVTAGDPRKAVEEAVRSLGGGPRVAGVADPFASGAVSGDGATAYATVTYTVESSDVTDADRAAVDAAADRARAAGLTVETGGSAMDAGGGPDGTADIVGRSAAAVVLLFTFGSLAAAGLPLLTAIVGVAVSLFGIVLLAGPLGLSSDTATLGMMLGLAVGIDYALFVVSRYREERGRGRGAADAAGVAVGTAGSAVVFAGVTVVIALAGLSVVGIPTLTKMGLAAAGAVAVAVLVALTVVPALLGFWPDAVLARTARRARTSGAGAGAGVGVGAGDGVAGPSDRAVGGRDNLGTRWARFVLRR